MAEIEKKTKRYPTDLTDEEWAQVQPFLPGAAKQGRPVETDLREVLNAIRYLARSGGGWRMLPKDFPPWPTVYWWFRRFVRRFMFQTIHDVALMIDRELAGREASPTGGVIDSQSVKAPEAKTRGYARRRQRASKAAEDIRDRALGDLQAKELAHDPRQPLKADMVRMMKIHQKRADPRTKRRTRRQACRGVRPEPMTASASATHQLHPGDDRSDRRQIDMIIAGPDTLKPISNIGSAMAADTGRHALCSIWRLR